MNKILSAILIYCICLSVLAAPPVAVNGEQASNVYVQNIKLPNYQATKLAGLDTRIETGNTNLVLDPSFESTDPVTSAGWVITNADVPTLKRTSGFMDDGKQSLYIPASISGTGATAVLDVSTNAAGLKGQQGVVAISVRRDNVAPTASVTVCSRVDGVTGSGSSSCATVPVYDANNPFKRIVIPVVMGGTSTGISIKATGFEGYYLDSLYIGAGLPLQNVSGATLLGSIRYAATASCNWPTSSTSFGNLSANSNCPTPTVTGQAIYTGSKIPQLQFASLKAGTYYLVATGYFATNTSTLSGGGFGRFSDGTNVTASSALGLSFSGSTNNQSISNSLLGKFEYSTSQTNVTFNLQTRTVNASNPFYTNSDVSDLEISVYYYPPDSKIYSQASQDYDWTLFTPTSPNNSITFTSPNCYHKREGSDLLLRCNAIIGGGTSSGLTAQMALPNSLTTSSTLSTSSLVGTRTVGTNTATSFYIMAQPSVGYITFSNQNGSTNAQSLATGSVVLDANQQSWYARIPIQGWQDYGVIVGSFAGIEKCANDYECTDTFSAQISSAGVVSNENLDWINGNASIGGTSQFTINFNSNLKDGTSSLSSLMNCTAIAVDVNSNNNIQIFSQTTSQIVIETAGNGALLTRGFTLKCQKGTNDYKPKTAKVATSIGVPVVPGITTTGTGNSIDTFSLGYGGATATTACSSNPCTVYNQIGSGTTVGWTSTGLMTLGTSKTYAKLNCTGWAGNTANINNMDIMTITPCTSGACTSLVFRTTNAGNTLDNTYGTLYCQGSY